MVRRYRSRLRSCPSAGTVGTWCLRLACSFHGLVNHHIQRSVAVKILLSLPQTRLALRLTALFLLLGAGACVGASANTTSPPVQEVAGTYTLIAIDGHTPPYVIEDTPAQQVVLMPAKLVISGDGQWRTSLTYALLHKPTGAVEQIFDMNSGTYRHEPGILQLAEGDETEVTAVADGVEIKLRSHLHDQERELRFRR